MEKGHFGHYTGNARHSRKEEMIHDRELIYDAKKQLHNADRDYKHDSPAKMYGKKESPVNGNAFTKAMADSGGDYDKAKKMLDSPARMNADLKYDPVNDRADSPIGMYGKKENPIHNSGLGPKKAGSGAYMGSPAKNVGCKYTKRK